MATSVISDRNFNVRSVNYAIISCSLSFILSQHANKPGGDKSLFPNRLKETARCFQEGKKKMSPLLQYASAAPVLPRSDELACCI